MRYPGSCPGILLLSVFTACALFSLVAPARADATPETARITLPVYGVSFDPPKGEWVSNPCPIYPNIVMYRLIDAQHRVIAELDIQSNETKPFERHTLDEFALAQNAEVLVQTFAIDNAPTLAVRKEHGDDKCGAFLMLVADHDTRSYTFSVQASGDNAPTHDLITLVKSVKWMAPEDPLLHIGQPQKVSIFQDSKQDAAIQLPTIFRRLVQNKQSDFDVFLATDAAGKQLAAISFLFIPSSADLPGIPQDDKLLELRRHLLETAQKRWGTPDFPLMDINNPLDHGVVTSPTVPPDSLSSDARMIKSVSRYGAIFNKPGLTEVEMRSFGDPGDSSARWDKILLDIANSLRFSASSSTPSTTISP